MAPPAGIEQMQRRQRRRGSGGGLLIALCLTWCHALAAAVLIGVCIKPAAGETQAPTGLAPIHRIRAAPRLLGAPPPAGTHTRTSAPRACAPLTQLFFRFAPTYPVPALMHARPHPRSLAHHCRPDSPSSPIHAGAHRLPETLDRVRAGHGLPPLGAAPRGAGGARQPPLPGQQSLVAPPAGPVISYARLDLAAPCVLESRTNMTTSLIVEVFDYLDKGVSYCIR